MMRKQLAVVALATIVTCGLVWSSHAQVIFEDGFNYTAGSGLGGQTSPYTGNPTWNGGDAANVFMVSGHLSYPGLQTLPGNILEDLNGTSGSIYLNFGAAQSATQVYYSFLFDPIVADGANDYIWALNPANSTPNGSSDKLNMYSYSSGNIEMRANPDSATGGSSPVAPALNTTNLVVEEIDLVNHVANLWVNPGSTTFGSDSSVPTPTATLTGVNGTTIGDIGIKSQGTTGEFYLDNLIVGNDWASVTPAIVPEPSTCLLLGSGLVMLLGFIRRRRN